MVLFESRVRPRTSVVEESCREVAEQAEVQLSLLSQDFTSNWLYARYEANISPSYVDNEYSSKARVVTTGLKKFQLMQHYWQDYLHVLLRKDVGPSS